MKNKKVLLIARFSVQNFKVSVESWKSYIVHMVILYDENSLIIILLNAMLHIYKWVANGEMRMSRRWKKNLYSVFATTPMQIIFFFKDIHNYNFSVGIFDSLFKIQGSPVWCKKYHPLPILPVCSRDMYVPFWEF